MQCILSISVVLLSLISISGRMYPSTMMSPLSFELMMVKNVLGKHHKVIHFRIILSIKILLNLTETFIKEQCNR